MTEITEDRIREIVREEIAARATEEARRAVAERWTAFERESANYDRRLLARMESLRMRQL